MIATAQIQSFPERWDAPVAGGGTYMFDPMHYPNPCTPLTISALRPPLAHGFTKAVREYNRPIRQVHVMARNLYVFMWLEMIQPATDEEADRMDELAEATLKPVVTHLLNRWNEEHLPAVLAHINRIRAMEIESAPASVLADFLDEVVTILDDLYTIHFRIISPMLMGLQMYDEFYLDLFGGEIGDGHALLNGVSSESVKAGLGLFDLAVRARELGLAELVRDNQSDRLPEILSKSEAGRAFMAEVTDYLSKYGYRQDLFELSTPTWFEEPTIALTNIKNYLLTNRDENQEYVATQSRAESALATANASLATYPEAVREQFASMVEIGRAASFLQEEHNFYIDQLALATIRLTFLRFADRLSAAKIFEKPDDIFFLEVPEIRALLIDLATETDIRETIRTRRNQLEQACAMTPPPFIGEPPQASPPGSNPMERAVGRFWGGPPKESAESNQINGNAGSRGLVTGTAFVALTLEEATHVQPGQILVAVTTMPAWTPLFGVVAAVVTETGGPLSHCAIVAREYGIPAVVGAYGATQRIHTGQTITVDGGSGTVKIGAE